MIINMDWKDNKHVIIPEGTKLSERMFQYNNIVETTLYQMILPFCQNISVLAVKT